MAKWTTLKAAIAKVIKNNGNQEITGAVLQSVLNNIVSSLGENYQFVGIATASTNPGTPDGNVFYIAGEGTYTNFSGLVIEVGQLGILKWNGSWSKQVLELGASGGNMILNWNTDVETTRKQVLQKYRKAGIQISYKNPEKGWVNEQFIGTNVSSDLQWADSTNWEQIPNQKLINNKFFDYNFLRTDNLINSIQLEYWEDKSFVSQGYEVRYAIPLDKSKIYTAAPYIANENVSNILVYAVNFSDELINQSYYAVLSTSDYAKIDFTTKSYYDEIKNLVLVVKAKSYYSIDIERDIPPLKIMISEGIEKKEYVDYLQPYSSEDIKRDIQENKDEIEQQKENVEKIPTIENAVKIYNISKYEVQTSADSKLYGSETSPAYFDEEFLNGVKKVTGVKLYTWSTEADFKVYAINAVKKEYREVGTFHSQRNNLVQYFDLNFELQENEGIGLSSLNGVHGISIINSNDGYYYKIYSLSNGTLSTSKNQGHFDVQFISEYYQDAIQVEKSIDKLSTKINRNSIYNVLDYGLMPSESYVNTIGENNMAKIQELITKISESGGGSIYFPAGTYYFGDAYNITLQSNMKLYGDGIGITRLKCCMIVGRDVNHISLHDFTIDNEEDGITTWAMAYKGIYITNISSSILFNIELKNIVSTGLGCDNLFDVIMDRIFCYTCGRLFKDSPGNKGCAGIGIGEQDNDVCNWVVTNCVAKDCGQFGIFVENMKQTFYGADVTPIKSKVITNCICDGNKKHGIGVQSTANLVISNNVCTNNKDAGILVEYKCKNINIVGNIVENNGTSSEAVSDYDYTINPNGGGIAIKRSTAPGGIENITIFNNQINGNVGNGITADIRDMNKAFVNNNMINNNTDAAINISGTGYKDIVIVNNFGRGNVGGIAGNVSSDDGSKIENNYVL